MRVALAAKRPERVMAITDGTAGSGLPRGDQDARSAADRSRFGDAAYLDDGTLAGSSLTMDRAFAKLVARVGLSLPDAADGVLDDAGAGAGAAGVRRDCRRGDGRPRGPRPGLRVVQTWIAGSLAYDSLRTGPGATPAQE